MRTASKLLLHTCCGPCASAVVEQLLPKYDLTLYFSNSNLNTEEEYEKRKKELYKVAKYFNLPFIEDAYAPNEWLAKVFGLESEPEQGKRCLECFKYRLNRTAKKAAELAIPNYESTLAISPWKNVAQIKQAGGANFIGQNYQQFYQRSVELSKQLGLYRQKFCGCKYSASP